MNMLVEVSVLGPVRVRGSGGYGVIPQQRVRAVLTSLAAQPRQAVSADEIIADVWGVDAPSGAATTVRSYVARLRRVLAPHLDGLAVTDVVVTGGGGYLLQVEDRQLDWCRLVADVEEGRALLHGGDVRSAALVLHRGLAEWRGAPFIDIAGSSRGAALTAWLQEVRLTALQLEDEGLLRGDDYERHVPRLAALVVEYPLQERLWEQLVLSLTRCGRRAEALVVFGQARVALSQGLGVEPGSRLSAAYRGARLEGGTAGDPGWDRRRTDVDRRLVTRRQPGAGPCTPASGPVVTS
ncbi:AfsR/SARP family transcriptional regulator [Modestobacter sp. URMC 112]